MISPNAASQQQASFCQTCGTHINTGIAGDLGCLSCMLRAGILDESTLSRSRADHEFDSLGDYIIVRHEDGTLWELGRGAMGVTYRAQDLSLQRQVALKVINADFTGRRPQARIRFTREARTAAVLRHPNVATVHQFGTDEKSGQCFYAMELVEGETLEERVRRTGPVDITTVVQIARQVTSALAAAEKRGLVHRDLKPGNIMVCTDDNDALIAKVIDFGLAKALAETPDARTLTQNGFVGTPAFASPEQLNAKSVDIRSDIYSLGATLWYLLTGQMPFGDRQSSRGPPVEQLKAAHVPSGFTSLLVSMLAQEAAARPSVRDLAEQLQGVDRRLGARASRPFVVAGIAAAALALTAGATFLLTRSATKQPVPPTTIAVLPFSDSTDDKVNSSLTAGMQEEILGQLSRIPGLITLSSRTIEQAGDKAKDVGSLNTIVGATHVVQGRVEQLKGQMVVEVSLINATTAAPLWTRRFQTQTNGIIGVETEIAKSVVQTLKGQLTPTEKTAIEQSQVHDLQAYELYLQARSLLRRFGNIGPAVDLTRPQAIELLEQAIARDPKFAPAYALLSQAHAAPVYNQETSAQEMQKAKKAAEMAIQLDPQLPEAHLTLGNLYWLHFKQKERAVEEWNRAQRLAPNNPAVLAELATAAIEDGDWKVAFDTLERARQLEPLEPTWADRLGNLHMHFRHYDEAETIADQMIAKLQEANPPEFWILKRNIAVARGDTTDAAVAGEKSNELQKGYMNIYYYMAEVALLQHKYVEAAESLDNFRERASKTVTNPAAIRNLNVNSVAAGRTQLLLGIARRALREHDQAMAAFTTSEQRLREALHTTPEDAELLGMLTLAIAGQGRRNDTLREIQNATATFPLSREPLQSVLLRGYVANAYAWTGDHSLALELLQQIVHLPGGPTAGDLKLNPRWDDLREDPRFQQAIAEATNSIAL